MPSLIDPPDFNNIAEQLQEDAQAAEARNIPRAQLLPPREPTDPIVDATNIMLGDFGRALGFTLDQKSLRWDLETAKDAWVDHPVQSAIEVGINLAPVAFKALQFSRAKKIAGVSDETLRAMNFIDEDVDISQISEKTKNIAKSQIYNLQKKRNLADKIESGLATKSETMLHALDKRFGNSYMEAADPVASAEYMNGWVESFKKNVADNETFRQLYKLAPPDEHGIKIAQFFSDPSKLTEIPEKYRPWALQMADELRTTQSQMVKEGLLSSDEAEKVGPTWFSMLREGTPSADVGAYTKVLSTDPSGKTQMLSVPKTYSPNLLQRKMSKPEVQDFLVRKEAAQLLEQGDNAGALGILDTAKHASARKLIEDGKQFDAVKLLNLDGKVDLTPKNLTVGSLAQQKALLESYRWVRDIAIKYGKKAADLTPEMKASWSSLDDMFGSDRVRRMVGTAKGLDTPADELGFIPKHLYNEIEEVTGAGGKRGSIIDLMDLGSAILKTVKTSANPSTHGQNILGNAILMWNSGVNIFGKEYLSAQSQAWSAIRGMQKSFREKGAIGELGNLGSVTGVTGKEIKLADELNSKEVQSLIEMSSLLSSEGIGTIQRITEAAGKGSFTKMAGHLFQKAAKITRLDKAADVYMAEDGAMKFAHFLTLRQRGLSRQSAVLEVGKRLPMYNTVGPVWKGLRKSAQPWITFPVEITRIMKNNMMDYPLRTSMVLQMPHFLQLGSYGGMQALGRGQTYQTINDRKSQLPEWAQKPSTVMTPWVDRNGDFRHATLDFLPYTSMFPETTSKDSPITQQLPIFREWFPIMSGFYHALTGKDAWGRDIPTNSITQKVSTAALETAGLLSPPLVDKYVMNSQDPKLFYRLHQDLGQYPNQFTGKEGDPMFDLFLNSVVGLKSYPSSPEQAIATKTFKNRDLDSYKSRVSKEASALLKIGDTQGAGEKLSDVYEILLQQHGEPAIARRKFNAFISRFAKRNKSAKVLQGLSTDQIDRELDMAGDSLAYESNSVREQFVQSLKDERANRKHSSRDGSENPLMPSMPSMGAMPSF